MMLPQTSGILNGGLEFSEPSSFTFYLDAHNDLVCGYTDNREAMEQAVYLALETERYKYLIFSRNYGAELEDLFGMPISYVLPEIKRRVKEALLRDRRIKAVDEFEFEINKNVVLAKFKVYTIFGDFTVKKEVGI